MKISYQQQTGRSAERKEGEIHQTKTGSEVSSRGKEGEGGETRAKAEGAGAGGGAREDLERVLATTFSGPGT